MNILSTKKMTEVSELLCGQHSDYYDAAEYKGHVFNRAACFSAVKESKKEAMEYIRAVVKTGTPPRW